jgi:hypothetical protein
MGVARRLTGLASTFPAHVLPGISACSMKAASKQSVALLPRVILPPPALL